MPIYVRAHKIGDRRQRTKSEVKSEIIFFLSDITAITFDMCTECGMI